MRKQGAPRKHSPISVHTTDNGQLYVNWEQDYQGEYLCDRCGVAIKRFQHHSKNVCKLVLRCGSCHREIPLSQQFPRVRRKHPPVSIHPTQRAPLHVDWSKAYQNEYKCPNCQTGNLIRPTFKDNSTCKLSLSCDTCKCYINLTCKVSAHIFNYLKEYTCPNPLCTQLGPAGQRGWIYKVPHEVSFCRCHFCDISFSPTSSSTASWMRVQQKQELKPFRFDEDIWDLHHFFERPQLKSLRFEGIQPLWFQDIGKRYLHHVLSTTAHRSTGPIKHRQTVLVQLGQVLQQRHIHQITDIDRELVLALLDTWSKIKAINCKISHLKEFFMWLGLNERQLLKRHDLQKQNHGDEVDWLDQPTRELIQSSLNKIPPPIARHYLVQENIAARPGDICRLHFDCLVQENGKWYVQFFQNKVNRWHKIPASRKIRQVIEEQQQWIRQTFGVDYAYLFCHFRMIKTSGYPTFLKIKPLPEPPKDDKSSPMLRIIRCLIEKEDIRDANGQRPHFISKITRSSRVQEVRVKYGVEAAQLYADHNSSDVTLRHYAPPTREEVAKVDLPFQALLLNRDNKFLPWESLPESLLKNSKAHELDLEIGPRFLVYGYCDIQPTTKRCPHDLYPKCYGCSSFHPSMYKLPLYERQFAGEVQRMEEAQAAGAELVYEEAKAVIAAMNEWLPQLREEGNGEEARPKKANRRSCSDPGAEKEGETREGL